MPRLRHLAAVLAVLAAVVGIAAVAIALPGGSSGKSAAAQAPSRQPAAAAASSVPAGVEAGSSNPDQDAHARQAEALNAQKARFYAGVAHTLQARWYAAALHAQQERFYAGVYHTMVVRWVAGLQRGAAQGAAIARWEAGLQRGAAITRWVEGLQRGAAQGAAIARWEAGLQRGHADSSYSGGSSAGSGACGGDLPTCCILQHESGGNPTAVNASSGAAGLWQFMPSTWAGYGGYASAAQAPVSVQNAKARLVWAGGAGASNWAGDGC